MKGINNKTSLDNNNMDSLNKFKCNSSQLNLLQDNLYKVNNIKDITNIKTNYEILTLYENKLLINLIYIKNIFTIHI